MNEGWVRLYRKIQHCPFWKSEPFTKGQAWVDLILLARHDQGEITIKNGAVITIKRGQVGVSVLGLAERWQWSRGKVRRFISYLTKRQMVTLNTVENRQLISITNYHSHQGGTLNDTVNDTVNGHQTVQLTDTNNTLKNDKEGKEVIKSKPKKPRTKKPSHDEIIVLIGQYDLSPRLASAVSDFAQHKIEKKDPLTALALKKLVNKINRDFESDEEAIQAIETAIISGWKGIYVDKFKGNNKKQKPKGTGNVFLDLLNSGRLDNED